MTTVYSDFVNYLVFELLKEHSSCGFVTALLFECPASVVVAACPAGRKLVYCLICNMFMCHCVLCEQKLVYCLICNMCACHCVLCEQKLALGDFRASQRKWQRMGEILNCVSVCNAFSSSSCLSQTVCL